MSALTGDYQPQAKNWLSSLKYNDLARLRRAVRKVHMAYLPGSLYSDRQADMLIEALGPEVGERLIKHAVDAGL